jgi:hypothetical protein
MMMIGFEILIILAHAAFADQFILSTAVSSLMTILNIIILTPVSYLLTLTKIVFLFHWQLIQHCFPTIFSFT